MTRLARAAAFLLVPLTILAGCTPEDTSEEEEAGYSFFEVHPPEGAQGMDAEVVITADRSTFDFANTNVFFGQGIVVNSVTVTDGWTTIADVTIEPDAEIGKRAVQAAVGDLTYEVGNFRVVGESFTVSPDRGKIGETVDVTLEGHNTHWKDGRTWVNFGDDVDVLDVQVLAEELVQVEISIDGDAVPGMRDVWTEDGGKIVTRYDGFQIDRVALVAEFDPPQGDQGDQIEFTIRARDTNFQQGVTSLVFYDAGGLNPDIRVDDITVLDAENLWGRMTLSNAAELGMRDVILTTGEEGVRVPDAFEVLGGEWSLEEVAVSLSFTVTRGLNNETGELSENVNAGAVFFIPLDPPCGGGGSGMGSAPSPEPYDSNVVGPITGSGSGGEAEDCPNPTTVSAGDYVWLESDANIVTLEKQVDSNSGLITYSAVGLTIDDYVPDNLYDLHLQGDPDGLEEEVIDGVQPTVPCNWYMESPGLWGNYTQDRSTNLDYVWTNTEGGYGACTYPDAIFYTEISGTTYNGTTDPGMAASYPWDDGYHSYTPDELLYLDPGQVYFIAYSYIEGREFGLRDSIYQTNVANSYIYFQASFILE
ncbi:MAG: hypothetical protein GY913_29145 [Proteobacteria bacterium]|nr:hypothetical protein [Pseudomonadota bacterium]MCP4920981.1 hypothetical protein [Pseudomonadota bacterium]